MVFLSSANRIRRQTEKRLAHYSRPSVSYFLLIGLAAAIATLGLILDNTGIVIGAMVVAPLITPIFGFSLGLLVFRPKRLAISLYMLFLGTLLAIGVSAVLAWIVSFIEGQNIVLTNEILARTEPHFLYFLVALFSGAAGAYAYSKEEILASIAGIAISVAVIPPLAVTGIGVVLMSATLVSNSLLLFLLNLAGIAFGSIITFVALGFGNNT